MRLHCLVLLMNYGLYVIAAYKIPDIEFEILDDGFQVSVPDEPGVQRVFYIMQIDGSCPALMDYITEPVKDAWTSLQRIHLQNNDKVEVSVMVQYNDAIYERTQTKVILNTRIHTTRQSKTHNIKFEKPKCMDIMAMQKDLKPCKQAQTILGNNQPTCKGDLIFEDTFDDNGLLNSSTWKHDIRQRMYHVEEELVAFDNKDRNCYIKDGSLHIVPTVAPEVTEGTYHLGDKCTAVESPAQECNIANGRLFFIKPPVESAQIHTRDSFSFKYGRIEVRAKLPKGDWLFPYLMLQPMSTYAESHYAKQLRIAFARGNANLNSVDDEDISGKRLYGGMQFWQNGKPTFYLKEQLAAKHYGDDFHVYSMLWQREKISLFVDGQSFGEIYDGLDIFNEKCFIIFGVTVGGFQNFDDNLIKSDKPYKNRDPKAALQFWRSKDSWEPTWGVNKALQIDYVRVYAE